MTAASVDLGLGGERVRLLGARAAYLPAHAVLLLADLHLGKGQAFRHLGVPVPRGSSGETLARVDALLAATGATRLVVLGDLLHAARGRGAALDDEVTRAIDRWRARRPGLQLELVRGNHDRHAGDPPPAWGVRVAEDLLRLGGIALRHEPAALEGAYVLAGHLHPVLRLAGPAHDRLRLPCFRIGARVGVLPAFGAFTGGHPVRPAAGERLFVADGESVHELPPVRDALRA
ncbi:MAG: ligase-associated DNA damage response endonuclease PdeM [Rhodoferax sp.]|jgi:DNA ligase-associated metallophosphoesterase|nr:ligase-associated DNA damage response endonuclease PdeM [Rhodoferax sp.]MCL4737229.1 ligase-associated DNA damage response endonuclease PdeM [Burkholderiaceae bacterium]MCP5290492.1 ligase-associated DNA damage response endonuclease PdeM [Burkholderiaceae bacterium]